MPHVDPGQYRRLIGNLIYLPTTKPNVTFVMGVLSQYMQNLHQLHCTTTCRILRYLKRALNKELYYCLLSHLDIVIYSDVDQVSNPISRRSTTGY